MTRKSFFLFVMQFAVTMLITYATVTLFNRYILKQNNNGTAMPAQRGQSFTAPAETQVTRPINREIDFIDAKSSKKPVLTTAQTQWGSITFSSDGATMHRFEVNRELDGKASSISTVFPPTAYEREAQCFLVALDRPTPYHYQFAGKKEQADTVAITYKASFEKGSITKTFVVHKDIFKIDVALEVQSAQDDPVRARMLFAAPEMIELQGKDTIAGFVLEERKIKRFDQSSIPMNEGWRSPTLFGLSDRYFVHALVADDAHMIEHAYFWKTQESQLFGCIESKAIAGRESMTWSFYFGPKDTDDIRAVDSRLEELVDYSGWFGPISVLLLKLLKYLNKYLHNFGFAIIALTLLMRLVMLPIAFSGEKQRKQRAELDKKIRYLKQKYKDNPERFQKEQYELIRKHGIGGIGCLMSLVQIPFFFGLNRLLATSIELYKAPFIPGWISDLSAPDPYYILPTLFALGMLITSAQMDKSQRSMLVIMGVVGAVIFSSFAAGLVLFFVVSMFAGIVSTYIAKKLKWA